MVELCARRGCATEWSSVDLKSASLVRDPSKLGSHARWNLMSVEVVDPAGMLCLRIEGGVTLHSMHGLT